MLTIDQVRTDVDAALKSLVASTGQTFSYSIVPNKPWGNPGLDATWNSWFLDLRDLQDNHLVNRPEYANWAVDPLLVDISLSKTLVSAHRQIVKRLWLLISNP